ncbi:MAG: hypothetical protein QXD04_06995 [Candidatus Bathyarchaeia archaeon]
MVAVRTLIVSRETLMEAIIELSTRYNTVKIFFPGSFEHKAKGLRDDVVLLRAWGPSKKPKDRPQA